jgi:hypothetical protein
MFREDLIADDVGRQRDGAVHAFQLVQKLACADRVVLLVREDGKLLLEQRDRVGSDLAGHKDFGFHVGVAGVPEVPFFIGVRAGLTRRAATD